MTTHRRQTEAIRTMLRCAARGAAPTEDEVDELRRLRVPNATVDATVSAAQAAARQYDPATTRTWTQANKVGDDLAADIVDGLDPRDRTDGGDNEAAGKVLANAAAGAIGGGEAHVTSPSDKRSVPWKQSLGY